MGEYATVDGQTFKLGTCDDWRYVRRDECERWATEATRNTFGLDAPDILYRFPVPWEDSDTLEHVQRRSMEDHDRIVIPLPADILAAGSIDHRKICQHMSAPRGAYQCNVTHPCPYALDADKSAAKLAGLFSSGAARPSQEDGGIYAYIVGERFGGDRGDRTVFACIYCKAWFYVAAPDVELIREAWAPTDADLTISKRLRGGATS